MIVFDFGCENNHRFEGWYSSTEDYERQQKGQLLSCPICSSVKIKRLITPIRLNSGKAGDQFEPSVNAQSLIQKKHSELVNFDPDHIMKMITQIIENTEDVGIAFPEEARKIYYKEAPERHIRGVASAEEVSALKDEGIEVVAFPISPHLANKSH